MTQGPDGGGEGGRPPLWRCPECGERFNSRNQRHACGVFDLEALFAGCDPPVRRLYERFRELVEAYGPVRVIPQKSRIAFQVRMRFAALTPRKRLLRGHLVLAERHEAPCFERVETLGPRSHVHHFRLTAEADLDDPAFRGFLHQAYGVGRQEHLPPPRA